MSLLRFLKFPLRSQKFHRLISRHYFEDVTLENLDWERSFLVVPFLPYDHSASALSQGLRYQPEKHHPCLTLLTREKVSDLTMQGRHEIPFAVMKGAPLTPREASNLIPEKDIWIVKKEETLKEATSVTDYSVVDSQEFKNWIAVLDLVTRNRTLPPKGDLESKATVGRLTGKEIRAIQEIVTPNTSPDSRFQSALTQVVGMHRIAAASIRKASELSWSNGDGGVAQSHLMNAACSVCVVHSKFLNSKTAPFCYAAMSPNNHSNNEYTVRTVDEEFLDIEDVNSQIAALRDPTRWHRSVHRYYKQEMDDCKYWTFRNTVPGNIIYVDVERPTERNDIEEVHVGGMVVGDVKSETVGQIDRIEHEAFVQALQGLHYNSKTAALVMGPKDAVFIEIWLENGMVLHRKKYYVLYELKTMDDNTSEGPIEVMSSTGYEELFRDLVLYMWNTYYIK